MKHRSCLLCSMALNCRDLTPFLPWCHLKTTNKSVKIEIPKSLLVLVFALACAGIFIKKHITESELLKDRKRYSLQACACTFQPGNWTGWCSEGVKARDPIKKVHIQLCTLFLNVPRPPPPSRPRPLSTMAWCTENWKDSHCVFRMQLSVCNISFAYAFVIPPAPRAFMSLFQTDIRYGIWTTRKK